MGKASHSEAGSPLSTLGPRETGNAEEAHRMKLKILASALATAVVIALVPTGASAQFAGPIPAPSTQTATDDVGTADACYTWRHNLKRGDSGKGVRKLQVRLAGWVSRGENLALDG